MIFFVKLQSTIKDMSSTSRTPTRSSARKLAPPGASPRVGKYLSAKGAFVLSIILWFLGVALVIGLILGFAKPPVVQNQTLLGTPDGTVNAAKVVWGAVISGLIAAIICAFVRARKLKAMGESF